ncbi:MAG: VCBS repeat-containing protein, partial [Planctomycetota bacterium]|nr:VCBS repeat-containing protein [Planctomycetota bacterium]
SSILEIAPAAERVDGRNLFDPSAARSISVVVPDEPNVLEQYAIEELAKHVEQTTGRKPKVVTAAKAGRFDGKNVIVFGWMKNNARLRDLAQRGMFRANGDEQGFAIRIASHPKGSAAGGWLAVLCGADPRGALYAVRDFSHYYFYRDSGVVILRPVDVSLAPVIKRRQLSASGCNMFTGDNPHELFMYDVRLNRNTRSARFDKPHYIDWLSEWKINAVTLLWCNYPAYDKAYADFVRYAHSRGIWVAAFFCPLVSLHEKPGDGKGSMDCPRDIETRRWYLRRLIELITRKPQVDGIVMETPEHDGHYCRCEKCKKNPYPGIKLLNEFVAEIRKHRPDMPISFSLKEPTPTAAAAKQVAERLIKLTGPTDSFGNSYRSRADRMHWHDLGPQYGTYLRPFRSRLKSKGPASEEIDGVFYDFRLAADRGVWTYGTCYRFYGGKLGSYRVSKDDEMRKKYPARKGPFSLALLGEASFDPFVEGEARAEKVRRISRLTMPDYPLGGRKLNEADFRAIGQTGKNGSGKPTPYVKAPVVEDPAARPSPSKLFRDQYGIKQPGFLLAQVCADLDCDGRREIFYSSRGTKLSHLLRADDGSVVWSKRFEGDHQSVCAYDIDGDGKYEILYSVSKPGRLYMLDHAGKILKQWDAGEWKLGNSAVIIDGDGDGVLDGYFGGRAKHLFRLNMRDLTLIKKRTPWLQCGCHTSAMDVDGDGRWDMFAGKGDDSTLKGMLHRYDPVTLEDVWSYKTNDNASSADAVLADIDGDGQVEIVKSVDNYAKDDDHDAVYAFETDGTPIWKVAGFSGEDSPNVADLDGDGSPEIVGMTFGGVVYCIDAKGRVKWQKDLRPELDDSAGAYMAPILCDLNGDKTLEILAITNGGYSKKNEANGILFALSADGKILDRFDVGSPRFWGTAFYVNVDDDPYMELVVSGSGGLDVIETKGFGPNTEHFQRRRGYQRLNVVPWAYEDSYFIYRGKKEGVCNQVDNLVLQRIGGAYGSSGSFATELLTLPPGCYYDRIEYGCSLPKGTSLRLDVLDG